MDRNLNVFVKQSEKNQLFATKNGFVVLNHSFATNFHLRQCQLKPVTSLIDHQKISKFSELNYYQPTTIPAKITKIGLKLSKSDCIVVSLDVVASHWLQQKVKLPYFANRQSKKSEKMFDQTTITPVKSTRKISFLK